MGYLGVGGTVPPMKMTFLRSVVAASVALGLAACGNDASTSTVSDSSASASVASVAPTTSMSNQSTPPQSFSSYTSRPKAITTVAKKFANVSGKCGEEPTLQVKAGTPGPKSLVVSDVCVGSGPIVQPQARVTALYTGIGLSTGQVFDSSWARSKPTFSLNEVIPGWAEGIPGMHVGGRRILVIPGAMAYGSNPPPGATILPNETLVFVVDIVSSP